jgi:hypothetical protein
MKNHKLERIFLFTLASLLLGGLAFSKNTHAGHGCFCRAYVGADECASPGAQEASLEHYTFVTISLTKTLAVWDIGTKQILKQK